MPYLFYYSSLLPLYHLPVQLLRLHLHLHLWNLALIENWYKVPVTISVGVRPANPNFADFFTQDIL